MVLAAGLGLKESFRTVFLVLDLGLGFEAPVFVLHLTTGGQETVTLASTLTWRRQSSLEQSPWDFCLDPGVLWNL